MVVSGRILRPRGNKVQSRVMKTILKWSQFNGNGAQEREKKGGGGQGKEAKHNQKPNGKGGETGKKVVRLCI